MKKIKKLLNNAKNRLLLTFPIFNFKDLPGAWKFWQLLTLIRILRGPNGCPWDKKQTLRSSYHHTREEFSEFWKALNSLLYSPDECIGTDAKLLELSEEVGDLLFTILFTLSLLVDEFKLKPTDPLSLLIKKMVRRHPHVFKWDSSDDAGTPSKWEQIKRNEKGKTISNYILDKVKPDLSPLREAENISRTAASVGFDWPDATSVLDKVKEEIAELEMEMFEDSDNYMKNRGKVEAELGDLLFSAVNLARHLRVDPEKALFSTIETFRRRFSFIEDSLRRQRLSFREVSLEELESLWQLAKKKSHTNKEISKN